MLKKLASPSLLETFTEERLPVVAEMLQKSSEMHKVTVEEIAGRASSRRGGVMFMLDINYRWSSIVLEERNKSELIAAEMKRYAYGGYEKGLCAGDRAPDATGLLVHSHSSVGIAKRVHGEDTTLFKLFDASRHSILVFASSSSSSPLCDGIDSLAMLPEAKETIQTFFVSKSPPSGATLDTDKSRMDAFLVDRDGHAHGAYLVGDEEFTVVIIRPDGYIGAITKDQGGLKRYFDKLFVH